MIDDGRWWTLGVGLALGGVVIARHFVLFRGEEWQIMETTIVPGTSSVMRLLRCGDRFAIQVDGRDLMNSETAVSERALAKIGCRSLTGRRAVRVLVGGLGLGFTLAETLRCLDADAQVVVAELVPAVVRWNRGPAGRPAGRPLDDRRVLVYEGDVANRIRDARGWDAILLDVDNGPTALVTSRNERLYDTATLGRIHTALRRDGVLVLWSATADLSFVQRLSNAGFYVSEHRVKQVNVEDPSTHMYHVIYVARRQEDSTSTTQRS